jgi:class 3 adenylate cyclase
MATRSTEQRQLAAVMFTDIVGFVAWAQRDVAEALGLEN